MIRISALTAACALLCTPVLADDISDALASALEAYEEGDLDYAMEELDYARSLMTALKTESLQAFLPEPPNGWTREVDSDISSGMAVFGGGVGAKATYSNGSESFTITIMANNPMVTAFGAMLGNAAMLGLKIERVGREKFLNDDGSLTGLIDDRIMVKAERGDVETMLKVLETMDFKGLEDFRG